MQNASHLILIFSLLLYSVPTQNNGTDCGVFVRRYAYNMVLMQNFKFTPGSIADVISNSPAFKLGMKDMSRIRKKLSTLILNLSSVYSTTTSSNDDVASTISDLVMLDDEHTSSHTKKYKSHHHSPRRKQSTKRPSRQPSPPCQPFNLFGKNQFHHQEQNAARNQVHNALLGELYQEMLRTCI